MRLPSKRHMTLCMKLKRRRMRPTRPQVCIGTTYDSCRTRSNSHTNFAAPLAAIPMGFIEKDVKKQHKVKDAAIKKALEAAAAAAKASVAAKEAAAAIPMGFIEQDVKAEHEAKRAKTEDGKIGFIEKDVIEEHTQ